MADRDSPWSDGSMDVLPRREQLLIDGRRIVIARGTSTQTVNVCTEANGVGDYEMRYRLPAHAEVRSEHLMSFSDLHELEAYLDRLMAQPEAPQASRPLPPAVPAPPASDPWVQEATRAVDAAIGELLEGFLRDPYLHRVEHSLHAELFALLTRQPTLQGTVEMAGPEHHRTQLVHKEWPETRPREKDGAPAGQGNFDLAVLAPAQVEKASVEQFRTGRIDPAIVIEIGLDYGLRHFEQDAEKLCNSAIAVPYLIHLSRLPLRETTSIEDAVTACEPPTRAAYAHRDPRTGQVRSKGLDGDSIENRVVEARPSAGETTSAQQLTLHEAMREVLRTAPGRRLSPHELCELVNRRGQYRMHDGRAVEVQQIHARAANYPHLFRRVGAEIEAVFG